MALIKFTCSKCNSDDVVRDAYAEWCVESQDWVLGSTYDSFACNECGAEDLDPDEVEVDENGDPINADENEE